MLFLCIAVVVLGSGYGKSCSDSFNVMIDDSEYPRVGPGPETVYGIEFEMTANSLDVLQMNAVLSCFCVVDFKADPSR